MDKRALQNYATWAKNNLEQQIALSLKSLGINSATDIKEARIVGDRTIIDGDFNSYPRELKNQRDNIIRLIKSDGYEHIVEEFAYTWFNRIIALRFMEIHDFLSHGFRGLSSRNGGVEPEILTHLNLVKEDLRLDLDYLEPLYRQGKIEEVYRKVLFAQCNVLSRRLPMLFSSEMDYMELLLPKILLRGETVITKLVELGEEPFADEVEVIGWLYQFYVSSDRQAFREAKIVTKDLIPTLTQVFTPDWIVRYMADNSVGRLWLESHPDSAIKKEFKYYVDDARQEPEVQKKIDQIKYKDFKPEDIKVIEPCCGSGHILVYVFDLLYKMYEEQGYQTRDIPTLILKNNLVGLEIDRRASQLASFALIMKARSKNSRFFNDNYYVKPMVYEILDSTLLLSVDYEKWIKESKILNNSQINEIEWLVDKFKYAKTIGSLLKVEKRNFAGIKESISLLRDNFVSNIFSNQFYTDGFDRLDKLVELAEVMSTKYDVMITNPPYLGISKIEKNAKDYLSKNYPDSKSDMFGMFMEAPYCKKNGFIAMVNPDSWMFLVSFEDLRKKIIHNQYIVNMVHLGMGAFDAVVQTTAFVIRNTPIATNGVYFRLVDQKDKEAAFLAGGIIMNISTYNSLPNALFGYWLSKKTIRNFVVGKPLGNYIEARNGFTTGNNDLFLRAWYEINNLKICFGATDSINALYTGKKWFPYNKGGDYRKWYGNQEYVINWMDNGKEIRAFGHLVPRSLNYMFFESISWSKICSSTISFRKFPRGFMFDVAGLSLFPKDNSSISKSYILGFLNSSVTQHYLNAMSPTLNYETGQIEQLPLIENNNNKINQLVESEVLISKVEWDSFETSWNFKKHPLI